jgi:hypothetical protein
MNATALVQIIGVPVACREGVKESWRDAAQWVGSQLAHRFGDAVRVQYFDLFDPGCPSFPPGSQLPVVLVNGEVVSSGGRISVPLIRRRLESLGETQGGPA